MMRVMETHGRKLAFSPAVGCEFLLFPPPTSREYRNDSGLNRLQPTRFADLLVLAQA
jgi:hypothetical protein